MTRYECAVDPAAVVAVDTHVHVEKDHHGHLSLPGEVLDAAAKYFKAPTDRMTIDETAQYYRERQMAAVVFTVDATTKLGHAPNSTEEIAEGAARNNDVLIPFGSVDPHAADAVDRARRQAEELGVRGFKFHPSLQDFDPSDERWFPLYAVIEEYRLPTIFHTGQTGIGARMPGGFGIKLGLSNPMLLDVVAATFPQMDIIMAHPSVPWQDEAIAVAGHKGNVYIDLSGWSPKYFPPALVKQANSLLQDKVLFASDFPLLTPERWLKDFAALDLKDEVRPKILKDNAVRLLGLASAADPAAPASARGESGA
ncbi:amidohydrolase family protein [Georgenia thermotolerans]|uniref:Amidohydrolase family protein n=1 Tax=Georgenia thermotolerans TaxID=527326 RepID=A0A7J5UPC1_9MICO|nr:amidohydrolase family protein [Georgenia thermotolerans]KAE8764255.1 amidohydrolase family protein [Georgenia thermotolerans]